jgi:WD40 repeat protein
LLADEYLWDVETGNLIRVYDNFVSLAWLPSGHTLVGLSVADGTVKVVSASSAKELNILEGFGAINGYGAAPLWDGDTLLTYNGVLEMRWDPIVGKMLEQRRVPEPSWISTEYTALSPDGQRRASPNGISDVNSNHQIILLDDQPEHDRDKVDWSPDGKRLVSGDSLGIADTVVWDAITGNILLRLSLEKDGYRPYLGALSWSPSGARITAAGSLMNMANGFDEGMVVIWDADTGQQLRLLRAGMKSERMVSATWSPDQHWLAAGSTSGKIFLWDMQTFIPVSVMEGHKDQVLSLSWSADGSLLSSSSMDGTVLIWKLP